jgi:predicted nucleic acid-binding protein
LDASVALSWFVDISVSPYAVQVRDQIRAGKRGVAPHLWLLEFVNGLLVAERRKIISATVTDESIAEMQRLRLVGIEVETEPPLVEKVLALARTFQLTAYDGLIWSWLCGRAAISDAWHSYAGGCQKSGGIAPEMSLRAAPAWHHCAGQRFCTGSHRGMKK